MLTKYGARQEIRDGVAAVCRRFDDGYWSKCETELKLPFDFHRAMPEDGWLGTIMPEEQGGAGLGVTTPGRAPAARGAGHPHRAGQRTVDPVVHRRARARAAKILLGRRTW
jgi:hypothetical protein